MIRLLASTVLHLLANTFGLLVASWVLDGFSINTSSFIAAVVLFTLAEVILGPFVISVALKNVPALVGGTALITTLVGLIITNIFTDGLSINGLNTWVVATLIIWLSALVAGLILPLVIFKKTLGKVKESAEA